MCQETTGKKTKIQQLYELYKTNPKLGNAEAAELLDTNERCIRIYRARLIEKGCVQYTEAGGMEVIGSYKNPELKVGPEYKAEVYKEDMTAAEGISARLQSWNRPSTPPGVTQKTAAYRFW